MAQVSLRRERYTYRYTTGSTTAADTAIETRLDAVAEQFYGYSEHGESKRV